MAQHLILEGAAPSTPSAGYLSVYASTDGRLNCKDDAGVAFTPPYKNGADVASATTLDLDSATGDWVDVTGTTTITAITLAQGKECTVRFTGVLTLTHGASLVLPNNGSNITTAAGDCAIFRGDASSVVRCVSYQRLNGESLVGEAGLIKLATGTVSAAATLDIDMTGYTAYPNKVLVLSNFVPVTDAVAFYMRTSTDGGSTFGASAGDYHTAAAGIGSAGTAADLSGNGQAQIQLNTASLDNAGSNGGGFNGVIHMYNTEGTVKTIFTWEAGMWNSAVSEFFHSHGSATRNDIQNTDAVRFLMSSGNIATGSWTLYGYK